ncbi:unnamed protein product [Brassicogethes aeneus]|uniref:GH18 domain-containing protein n=1 Tax=Brassicogethes aeneus TaxID=1431903 RepID=A0A9P0AY04_BRAAE|nr:unnamed protein product [Brassicogethes aeneus]
MKFTVFFVLFLVELIFKVSATNVVCYYMSTNGYGSVLPESINPNLCTHLNYAFVGLNKNGSLSYLNQDLDVKKNLFKRVSALKSINPDLKVLFSIASPIFTEVASNETKRELLANSAKEFLKTFNYDGIDLDWEFPKSNQTADYLNLLSDIRSVLGNKWLLTAALPSTPTAAYNATDIFKILDFANIMSYDYFGPWSSRTGQNSALFESSRDSGYEKKYLNVAIAAKNWIKVGANPSKINMGLPFYGRQFELKNSSIHGLHAPINGGGKRKAASFTIICRDYGNWTKVWDEEQKNPYKYLENQWIGYDDEESIALKTQHILSNKYAGVMVWHIGSDDVYGVCGGKNQTLLNVINKEIKNFNLKVEKI